MHRSTVVESLSDPRFNLLARYSHLYTIVNEVSIEDIKLKTQVQTSPLYAFIDEYSLSGEFQPMYLQTRMPDLWSVSGIVVGVIPNTCNLNDKNIRRVKVKDEVVNNSGTICKVYPIVQNCTIDDYKYDLFTTCPPPYHRTIDYTYYNISWQDDITVEELILSRDEIAIQKLLHIRREFEVDA